MLLARLSDLALVTFSNRVLSKPPRTDRLLSSAIQDWALSNHQTVSDTVQYAYYGAWGRAVLVTY